MDNESKMGVVVNCFTLNVLDHPADNSNVICQVNRLSEVEIDEAESTDKFYKIYTPTGIEGFCKKCFIWHGSYNSVLK